MQPLPATTLNPPLALRLSVTDRCNFRCRYCLPQGLTGRLPAKALPSLETLAEAVRWLAKILPISKVKFTGGEPLLRRGLVELVKQLAALPGLHDLSMTTNGSRLAESAEALHRAGLHRVNISLDTLHPQRFQELTGGRLQDTLDGLQAAKQCGLTPVKINAVLRRSSWREDVPELLDFAQAQGVELRFIELMETGLAVDWARSEFVAAGEVIAWLEDRGSVQTLSEMTCDPARSTQVIWNGRSVPVGWITPQSQRFCQGCNRLRLDAQGGLRRCLMDPHSFPLIERLATQPHSQVEAQVRQYLAAKLPPVQMGTSDQMAAVGG
jgi:GTP 3',8-cyclase